MWSVFCAFFGQAGYIISLNFFSPLVTSNAYLLEPFFAQILGYMIGLDKLPGVISLLGTGCALVGIMYIDRGAR